VGYLQVTKTYNKEKIYSIRTLVVVPIQSFQRDLVVLRLSILKLIIYSSGKDDSVYIHVVSDVFMGRVWVRGGGCIGSWWGKPEGKRPLGRPGRRWVDNIRMDLQEVGCGYVDWIGLAQDRDRWRTLVGTVMNLRVP
jgi:hypothetical protein